MSLQYSRTYTLAPSLHVSLCVSLVNIQLWAEHASHGRLPLWPPKALFGGRFNSRVVWHQEPTGRRLYSSVEPAELLWLDKDSLTARPRGASEALKTTTLMEKGRGEKNLRPFQGFCLGPRQPQELSQTRAKGGGFSGGSAAMMETVVWVLGWEDPLEEGMAAHCSILAWRIPWTEEPGGLQAMGSQRVDTTEASECACRAKGMTCSHNLEFGIKAFHTKRRDFLETSGQIQRKTNLK